MALPGLDEIATAETKRPSSQEQFLRNELNPLARLRRSLVGFSLEELTRYIRKTYGVAVQYRHADGPFEEGLQSFRRELIASLDSDKSTVIINFHGQSLGLPIGGHFSPVAAYDSASDRALILDVAAHKVEPYWVPLPDLFGAMRTRDGRHSRGYLTLSGASDTPRRR